MKKLLLIAIALTVAGAALGKKKPTEAAGVSGGKGTGKVYVFGVSQQLTDSVIFVTSICEVDSIDVEKKRVLMKGELTSPVNPKPGCRFAKRCPYATEACLQPQKLEEVEKDHFVSCCRVKEING